MSERLRRGGNWIAAAREIGKYPNAYIKVLESGDVELSWFPEKPLSHGYRMKFDRRLARLIAKRILSSLEATR